ncbi:MAG TPA: sulfatase [Candidatus Limnocylindria bacterium]|nr:sulfatase [Candidatus Limnocylindria bacterium]
MRWRETLACAGVVLAVGVTAATPASAAVCGTPAAGDAFADSVRTRLRCEYRRTFGLESACVDPAATCPALVDRVADLVFDGVTGLPSTGLRQERRCQRALATLASKYVARRHLELALGRREARAAARLLRRTVSRCAGVSPGGPIPTAGDACSPLGDPFDPVRAPACVRATAEAITQQALGVPLRPNVLLVLTDDQRADTLTYMPAVQEQLAARGVTFTEAFTSTSLCCPDRASILTGLYAHHHGVRTNAGANAFDHDRDTIARQLSENAGYATALVGKYMVGTGTALGATVPPGWDEWHVFTSDGGFSPYGLYYGYQLNTNGQLATYGLDAGGQPLAAEYSTDLLRDRALALVERWSERPFFVAYAPFAPHVPAVPAPRHAGTFALLPPARPPSHLEPDISDKPAWVGFYQFLFFATGGSVAAVDQTRIAQLETLLAVDEAVAALSDRLETLGLTDNTVVVFTSDNGFLWLEHWLTLKNYPYEESIRLPLVIRYPALAPAPATTDAMALPIDFYPTVAELAGIPGEPVNGASLVDVLRGTASSWRDAILLEHWAPVAFVATSTGVRTSRWKLIETQATSGITTELYDLLADPYELNNVADVSANAAVLAALRARLAALLAE